MFYLITDSIDSEFMMSKPQLQADTPFEKIQSLEMVIGFIDGMVLDIGRQNSKLPQQVVYSGHKRKKALKY